MYMYMYKYRNVCMNIYIYIYIYIYACMPSGKLTQFEPEHELQYFEWKQIFQQRQGIIPSQDHIWQTLAALIHLGEAGFWHPK